MDVCSIESEIKVMASATSFGVVFYVQAMNEYFSFADW